MRFGRAPVIAAVRNALQHLEPTGGLLDLPNFDWASIFTTNFDRLIETAYRRHKKPLNSIRSNYDWGRSENSEGITLYKLHGCISQDLAMLHRAESIAADGLRRFPQDKFAYIELECTP